jgi:hypothetical protein
VEYTGSGEAADAVGGPLSRLDKAVLGFDYQIPAARFDLQRPGGRKVEVVAGARAWDEDEPGVNGRFVDRAAERGRQIWLTPHGAVLGALWAGLAAKVSVRNGQGIIDYVRDGVPIKIALDAHMRPARVEMRAGGHSYVGEYSDYKDFVGYNLVCPTRMSQSVDGKKVLDLTLTYCALNVYVPFPAPRP